MSLLQQHEAGAHFLAKHALLHCGCWGELWGREAWCPFSVPVALWKCESILCRVWVSERERVQKSQRRVHKGKGFILNACAARGVGGGAAGVNKSIERAPAYSTQKAQTNGQVIHAERHLHQSHTHSPRTQPSVSILYTVGQHTHIYIKYKELREIAVLHTGNFTVIAHWFAIWRRRATWLLGSIWFSFGVYTACKFIELTVTFGHSLIEQWRTAQKIYLPKL